MRRSIPLGPLRLDRVIGVGGAGEVWRGVHEAEDVPVAVKVITAARAREQRFREAFQNEVRAVAGLSHPGVVVVFDVGQVDEAAEAASKGRMVAGSPYLAMELATVGSLRTKAVPDSWRMLRGQLLWLLDVLAHAHANGVIHRDLKPGNVLVFDDPALASDDEGSSRLRLTDFGLAHATDRAERVIKGTSGTPLFMAPEQFRGTWRDFGPPTDLYALGCMAFAMAAGRPPYQARGVSALMQAHLSLPPPDLVPKFPVPEGFQAWLWRLMQKDPGLRFQRAADAAWALLDLGEPVQLSAAPVPAPEATDADTLTGHAFTPIMLDRRASRPLPSLRSGNPLAERRVPPLPSSWHEPRSAPSIRLIGAGLGLYGLRAIPLVGRVPERDVIWHALGATRELGEARAIVIRGPAGTGKSRLAEWIARRADEVGSAVVVRASHSASGGAADGLSRMVSAALGAVGLDRRELAERIDGWLRRRGVFDDYERRALLELVWPSSDGREGVRFGSANERYALIRRFLAALTSMQSEDGSLRPAVVWLDDVQWGGDALGLARYLLAPAADPLPLLLLLTVRDEALAERPAEAELITALEEHPAAARLDLPPLDADARAELVQRLLLLEGDLAAQVEARTGGNPLFAVQLVGDWVQRGVLEVGETGFVLRSGEEAVLPDDIHALWNSRTERVLEGFSADARVVLELAALMGTEVETSEWLGACRVGRLDVPDGLVAALLGRRLAVAQPGGWAFAHGMLRESLERSAVESGRAPELHDAAATALRIRFDVARQPGLAARLGRHLYRAGRLAEALEPLRLGSDERRGMSDYGGAMRLIDLRDEVLEALGVPAEDPRWGEGWVDRAALLVGLGRLAEAEEVAERVVAQLGTGWDVLRPAALRHAATATAKRGDLGHAEELLQQGERAARAVGDELELARCLLFLGDVTRLMGRRDDAEGFCVRALQAFEMLEDVRGQADALMGLAAVAVARHDLAKTEALARKAAPLFEQVGGRFGMASAKNTLGDALRSQGDLEAAEQAYLEAEALLRALGSPDRFVPLFNVGFVQLARKRYVEARETLVPVLVEMRRTGRKGWEGALHAALLPWAAEARDWPAFEQHALQAAELLGASGFVDVDIAAAAEQGGDLAAEAGSPEMARAAWAVARDQWRILGEPGKVAAIEVRLR